MATAAWVSAGEPEKRKFDVPADLAEKSLRVFSVQSGSEVLFSSDAASGVRTNAIKGEFLPGEAVKKMLAGTTLYVRDERDGVFRIAAIPRPKAPGAALNPGQNDRPGEAKSGARSRDPPPGTSSAAQPNQLQTSQPQHNESPPVKNRTLFALLTGWLAGGAALQAQPTPPTKPAERKDEVVQLSPFLVSTERDSGWTASTTLIGTRTNQELANVPVSVDAITAEFMQDFAAYTMEDAGMFVASLVITDQLETGAGEGRVSYRGIVRPDAVRFMSNASRNFFPTYVQTDNYNVERLDFNKGANSLMFGDASPGGQTTVYTKRARPRNFGQATALYGSFGTRRLQLDVNRRLSDKLAARINLVERSNGTYIDFAESRLRAGHGALTFEPFRNTALRFEGEVGRYEVSRGVNQVRIRSQSAPGRGFVTNNRWYYTSDGEVIQRTANSPAAVDRVGVGGESITFLQGQTATVALMDRVGSNNVPSGRSLTLPGFHRSVNFLGPDDYQDRPYTVFTGWIEQKLGDLFVEAAFNQQSQRQYRNQNQFGTTISIDRGGRPFVDRVMDERDFGNRAKIGRLTASYPWRAGKWMEQFIVVSHEWQQNLIWSFRRNLANFAVVDANPTANIRNHLIAVRAYLDDPAFPTRGFYDRFKVSALPVTPTFRPGFYELTDANAPFNEKLYQRTFSASAAGSYFDGRFRTLLGLRRDALTRKLITTIPRDPIGQDLYLGTPEAAPNAYSYDPKLNIENTSYTGGLVYRIREGLNAYGAYSESFHWQRAVDFANTPLGPIVGDSREAGLKGQLFGRRLTVTLAAYEVNRNNTAFEWSPNLLDAPELEDLFNPNNLRPGDPNYLTIATGASDEERTTTSTQRSRGWETTLQMTRYKGIQARVTFSRNHVVATRDMSRFRSLYETARQRTAAALAPGGNPALAESAALLADAQEILAANDGVSEQDGPSSSRHALNWAMDYEFARDTWLRGTRLAIYGNWRDDYNIIFQNRIYRNGSQHPVGAYATHRRKIAGRETSFRLGLKNIVDLENSGRHRVWGISRLDATGAPEYTYRYVTPSTFDLSMTVDF